ncbi:peptidyl-prolyl cis-trans isomerase FKBP10 isoform X2 [Eurytemora carolleeae]|uniref:peptidyl-prolyl cis-trans isomerase FKBP10 isoform X2 n=1 Tax=Eurytemora carolleeae TaxID=1294199 RepID=UPI000C77E7BD|nr:peptidyl-prolyl cis-trans isomerase FKBP10 isoform X2 [Eurytemora carolleeae]|eukprot:XP_023331230.1 peptidyl-prolyl cis-trans isomerase FKBP10-like isoform X2 [Eurytemora affinis]
MKYVFLTLIFTILCAKVSGVEDEEGIVEEDISNYTKSGDIYFKTIWKPRDCIGPVVEEDSVTMNLEYRGETEGVKDIEKAITVRMGRGQTITLNGNGMLGMCLGERRSLIIPKHKIRSEFKVLLPDISEISTYLEAELVNLNGLRWEKFQSGLVLGVLEEADDESCERVVIDGDVLAVEYEGSLENGTVFDSSAARNAPFGPFTQGHHQIIAGYEEALAGRCLGDRFKMIVPPHLAYGESGIDGTIPLSVTFYFNSCFQKLMKLSLPLPHFTLTAVFLGIEITILHYVTLYFNSCFLEIKGTIPPSATLYFNSCFQKLKEPSLPPPLFTLTAVFRN